MLSLGGERLTPKVLNHYLHHDLGMQQLLWYFFGHLLIVEYPDHHQSLINSSLYYLWPLRKISSQSVHNFLSNVIQRQTDRQTNTTNNITSFAKVVNIAIYSFYIQMLRSCNTHHNQFFNWLPYLVNIFTLLIINDLDWKKEYSSYIQMFRSCNTHHTIN